MKSFLRNLFNQFDFITRPASLDQQNTYSKLSNLVCNETRPNLEIMGPTQSEILTSETLANTEQNRMSNYHPKMDTTIISSLDRTNQEVYNLMKHGKKQRLQV